MKKIFVTGIAGYIGSNLLRKFLAKYGDEILIYGIDKLLYGGASLIPFMGERNFIFIRDDIINIDKYEHLIDRDPVIVHLAARVGEPACKKYPEETYKTNVEASKKLIDLATSKGVKKFIFVSTCSNYGVVNKNDYANEDYPLNPISLYAESKVEIERYLMEKVKNNLNWTILRLATVYGISPRIRFDLTVNDFTMQAILYKKLKIFLPYSNRPYVHVDDVVNAIDLVIQNPQITFNEVFNVGDTSENYRKIDIVEKIKEIVGDFEVEFIEKGTDLRDYKVDFSKIKEILNFQITKRVPDGIVEIKELIQAGVISKFDDKFFYNVKIEV